MRPDSLCRWQVQVSVCYARRMFNPVAPCRYLLHTVYLLMAYIANPDLFVCSCRTWSFLDITHFYEEQRQPSSGSARSSCPKYGKSGPHCWRQEVSTQFVQQFVTSVTAPSLSYVVSFGAIQFVVEFGIAM